MVMLTSDCGVNASMSVAVLSVGVVSPVISSTLAVLLSVPVADASIWATTVNVAVPTGRAARRALTLPEPPLSATVEPLDAVADQLALVMVAGRMSLTGTATAVLGPLLAITIV